MSKPDTKTQILSAAIPLFAQQGFNGVSMRDLAAAVELHAPALYNHFRDKQSLYLAAIGQAFADKRTAIAAALQRSTDPQQQLTDFVSCLCELMCADSVFCRLIQRELLDGDEQRLQFLAQQIFEPQFLANMQLAQRLSPRCDAHMLALSMIGLISYHLDIGPLRRFLPGSKPEHETPAVIAKHVTQLILHGVQLPPVVE